MNFEPKTDDYMHTTKNCGPFVYSKHFITQVFHLGYKNNNLHNNTTMFVCFLSKHFRGVNGVTYIFNNLKNIYIFYKKL